MDREKILKRFKKLKEGSKITLKDCMSEKDIEEYNSRKKYKPSSKKTELTLSEKQQVKKFYNKLKQSPKVYGILNLSEDQFIFTFNNKHYLIRYDADSECMVIREDDEEHEIGFYELENYF